jgi:hypothetical protein
LNESESQLIVEEAAESQLIVESAEEIKEPL